MHIDKHHLLTQAYEVCLAIEGCGASHQLTEASTKACALMDAINAHLDGQKPCARVERHTGQFKDMAIMVWLGEQPAEGTILYEHRAV